jgi:hypothetical protein
MSRLPSVSVLCAQTLGTTAKKLIKTGAVDSHGNLTVSYRAARSTTFNAAFSGDGRYAR